MSEQDLRFVKDSIAHPTTLSNGTDSTESIKDFSGSGDPFFIDQVDILLDGDASISCKARVLVDGEPLAPGEGFIAGGGERVPLPVEREVMTSGELRLDFDNQDSSDRDALIVIRGGWVMET